MGSCCLPVDSCTRIDWAFHHHIMTPLIILCLAATALGAPQLPAGLTAAACPNYPYCDASTGFLEVPNVPGAAEVIQAQEQIIRSHQGIGGAPLPGIQAHAAAEAAVQHQSRAGFPAHFAAEQAILLSQGRTPAGLDAGRLAHFQAEQEVLALQG